MWLVFEPTIHEDVFSYSIMDICECPCLVAAIALPAALIPDMTFWQYFGKYNINFQIFYTILSHIPNPDYNQKIKNINREIKTFSLKLQNMGYGTQRHIWVRFKRRTDFGLWIDYLSIFLNWFQPRKWFEWCWLYIFKTIAKISCPRDGLGEHIYLNLRIGTTLHSHNWRIQISICLLYVIFPMDIF